MVERFTIDWEYDHGTPRLVRISTPTGPFVQHSDYATLEAEVSRLTALLQSAKDFIGRVSGAALGIAMSGDDHPNPDEVLMDFAHEGMDISASLRAFAEKAGA